MQKIEESSIHQSCCDLTTRQLSVSIIIPCRKIDEYTKECIKHCRRLDYANFEIILLPDDAPERIDGVKIVPTGSITPGAKRNIGVANAGGEICAFLDSDAYPRSDWLSTAVRYFDQPQIAAVGGPGLTPVNDDFMQKASGYVLSSFMVGTLSNRYKTTTYVESEDIHSCNLLARKSVLVEVGGWNEKYWPGEDTLICLAIKKHNKRLIQALDVVVFHHRRPLFKGHLQQIWRFGVHRGFFAKKYRGNSFKFIYFAPSISISTLFAGLIVSILDSLLMKVLLTAIAAYLILCLTVTLIQVRKAKLTLPIWCGIIATQIVYGVSFLIGLFKRDLKR